MAHPEARSVQEMTVGDVYMKKRRRLSRQQPSFCNGISRTGICVLSFLIVTSVCDGYLRSDQRNDWLICRETCHPYAAGDFRLALPLRLMPKASEPESAIPPPASVQGAQRLGGHRLFKTVGRGKWRAGRDSKP